MLGEDWQENPARITPPEWFEVIRLWRVCRGAMGYALLPDAGGVNDQAAWLLDALAQLSAMEATADEAARKAAG